MLSVHLLLHSRVELTLKYRVIWSDLSATDADAAPDVPGAIRMIEQFNKQKADKDG